MTDVLTARPETKIFRYRLEVNGRVYSGVSMSKVLTKHVQIRVRPEQVAFWKAVAAQQEITLSQLLREAADSYAHVRLTTP